MTCSRWNPQRDLLGTSLTCLLGRESMLVSFDQTGQRVHIWTLGTLVYIASQVFSLVHKHSYGQATTKRVPEFRIMNCV